MVPVSERQPPAGRFPVPGFVSYQAFTGVSGEGPLTCDWKMGRMTKLWVTNSGRGMAAYSREGLAYKLQEIMKIPKENFGRAEKLICNSKKLPSFPTQTSGPQPSATSPGVQVLSKES